MKKDKIHLSAPAFTDKEIESVVTFLNQKDYSFYSKTIKDFETTLENYLGNEKSVCCLYSGTAAIHLALIMAGVQKNDVVLCQSFTYSATVNPIIYQRATPVFVDSEEDTWNMCPDKLEQQILKCLAAGVVPKAIVVVHLYGMPAKIDKIQELASKHGIILIEDAAEALGSTYKGRLCGTFGDFGILSFNNNKLITTLGGGALVCNTKAEKERALYLATHAKEDRPYYHHVELGYNYRINALAAALGVAQMSRIGSNLEERKRLHEFYRRIFSNIKGIELQHEPNSTYSSNFWLNCIYSTDPNDLSLIEKLRTALEQDYIESRRVWKPMHIQPVFQAYQYGGGSVAERIFNTGLCLPSGSFYSKEDRERIRKVIVEAIC